jgi:MFS family permease
MRSPKLGALITGRVIAGIGEGLFLGTLVVYICEIAPARRRGPLASLIQFLVTIGLATGYFIAYGTARIQNSSAAWRIPLAFQAFVAFCFSIACSKLPPSLRSLFAKHMVDEAVLTLEKLGLESSELEQMASRASHDSIIADTSLLGSIRMHLKDMTRISQRRRESRPPLLASSWLCSNLAELMAYCIMLLCCSSKRV